MTTTRPATRCVAPRTLTAADQDLILRVTAGHPRDHAIFSIALGTGLRLAEIVGLNVGDAYHPDGTPRQRVHVRHEIAKGGRARRRVPPRPARPEARAPLGLQGRARRGARAGEAAVLQPVRHPHLEAPRPGRVAHLAADSGLRPAVRLPFAPALGGHEQLPGVAGPALGAAVRAACVAADDCDLPAPLRR